MDKYVKNKIEKQYAGNIRSALIGGISFWVLFVLLLILGFVLMRDVIPVWVYVVVGILAVAHTVIMIVRILKNKKRLQGEYDAYLQSPKYRAKVVDKDIIYRMWVMDSAENVIRQYADEFQCFVVTLLDYDGKEKKYLTTLEDYEMCKEDDPIVYYIKDEMAVEFETGEVMDGIVAYSLGGFSE